MSSYEDCEYEEEDEEDDVMTEELASLHLRDEYKVKQYIV